MTPTKKPRIYAWNEARPCPGREKPANGRRAIATDRATGAFAPANATGAPTRHERRQAWALVPRALKPAPARLDYLPPRTREALNRVITRRNALDRAMAEARGMAPNDSRCARFAGEHYRDALDRAVRSPGAGRRYWLNQAGVLSPGEAEA